MKITRENELLYSMKFTDAELQKVRAIATQSGETIADCLTAFFSGCLYKFNNVLQESEVSNELEG